MTGFKENVTLDELNEGATFDDDILTIQEGLIPDVQKVRIDGLPSTTNVAIGDTVYTLIVDRLFAF